MEPDLFHQEPQKEYKKAIVVGASSGMGKVTGNYQGFRSLDHLAGRKGFFQQEGIVLQG